MGVLCVNTAVFVAVVSFVAVRKAAAFVCVPKPNSSPQQQQVHTTATAVAGVSSRDSQARRAMGCSRRPRQDGYRLSTRRTRLSATAESEGPSGDGSEDGIPVMPPLPGMKTVVETAEEEEQRLAREWEDDGRRGNVLVRRREIPTPDRDPASVCQLVFQSLQNNDDPMLDYGAAVAIKFSSSRNAVKNLTPKEYGAFLRNDPDQMLLIDNAACRPAERAKVSPDGSQVLQRVELVGVYPETTKRLVDVQLSKEDECWKIDAITFAPRQ